MAVPSESVAFFTLLRSLRQLHERGYMDENSRRDIHCDSQTVLLLAELIDLPASFVLQVFAGVPVKEAEFVANWSLEKHGVRRVEWLDSWSARNGREITAEARRAACLCSSKPSGEGRVA